MSQSRLNNLAVLNIHKDMTDSLELGLPVDKMANWLYVKRKCGSFLFNKWKNGRKMQKYNYGRESFLYIIYLIRELLVKFCIQSC